MAFSDNEEVVEPLMYRRGGYSDSPIEPQARRGLDVVGGVLVVVSAFLLLGCAAYASTGSVDPAFYGNGTLLLNPFAEFVMRSSKRGACTAKGAPEGFPTPWAITLATNGAVEGSAPAVRSIGIQGVTDAALYFVCRGGPGGASGPPPGLKSYPASMMFLAGNYPGAAFEEQWRAEGTVVEVPMGFLGEYGFPAPDEALLSQVAASADFASKRAAAQAGSVQPATAAGRLEVATKADAISLDADVARAEALQRDGTLTPQESVKNGIRVYKLTPSRVEMLHGGPRWPAGPVRYEWTRSPTGGWMPPRRILPYSLPAAESASEL